MTNETGDDMTVEELMLDALTSIEIEITDGSTSFGLRRENKNSTWGERLAVRRFPRDVHETSIEVDQDAEVTAGMAVAAIAARGRVAISAIRGNRRIVKGWVSQGLTTHAGAIVVEVSPTGHRSSHLTIRATALKSIQNRRPARTAVERLTADLKSQAHVTFRDTD
jgi:hypothetical protein